MSEQNQQLTLDEIVAMNMSRLRRERNLTVSELARGLGISRPQVYDMERPRPGRSQREFRWRELVSLCRTLDTTLFELVLPPEGTLLDEGEEIIGILDRNASADDELDDFKAEPLDRYDMSLGVFGLPGDLTEADKLRQVLEKLRIEKQRRRRIFNEAFEYLFETLDEEQ